MHTKQMYKQSSSNKIKEKTTNKSKKNSFIYYAFKRLIDIIIGIVRLDNFNTDDNYNYDIKINQ